MGPSGPQPPVVTLASRYGAAGDVIGSRVAERLAVPFLGRAAPRRGAHRVGGADGGPGREDGPRSKLGRVTAGLGRLSTLTGEVGGGFERLDVEEREVRVGVEGFLAEAARSGGVAVGRGAMVVLRTVPWALHVHLGGPPSSRIAQAMGLEDIDHDTAAARLRAEDRARSSYVRRVYGVDPDDPAWYHLLLDATAVDVDTCVEVIVTTAVARTSDPRPSPPI